MGCRPLPRQGRPGDVKDDEGARLCRLQQHPAGNGAGPGGGELLRPAKHDLPIRSLCLRRRHRRRHWCHRNPPVLCSRRLRHSNQPDDCRRAVHGGLTEALAIAMGQEMDYDEYGNLKNASLLDFFLPTAVETPAWETDYTTTPSPHHPIGAKGVGESPNVGGVSAFSNAVNDAFAHLGLTHTAMPHDHWRVWKTAQSLGLTAD